MVAKKNTAVRGGRETGGDLGRVAGTGTATAEELGICGRNLRLDRMRRGSEDVVGDCRFLQDCATYSDPLVSRTSKIATGRGCLGQTDTYRKKHCRAFACKLFCGMLKDALRRARHRGRLLDGHDSCRLADKSPLRVPRGGSHGPPSS